jgi:hypothetical protein
VVVTVIVVEPLPLSEVGLKEQLVSVFAGGVQPKVTVPVNPPTAPTSMTTWPFLPRLTVKVWGTIVTL